MSFALRKGSLALYHPLLVRQLRSASSVSGNGRLQDRVAVVTGSSNGIGRAMALAFAREGAKVVCADLQPAARPETKLEATHEEAARNGGKSVFIATDTGEGESVRAAVEKAVSEYGRLDIMVNNAGIAPENQKVRRVHETTEEVYDKTMRVNAKGVFLGCKYAIGQFLKQDPVSSFGAGWIVNTGSICSVIGLEQYPAYSTAKGGVLQLTRQIAVDYGKDKIHCNVICPGFIKTELVKGLVADSVWSTKIIGDTPWGELAEPQEIAKAAVFLSSDDAGFITGQPLVVDGGYASR
ncbi:MAG: putative secondary metabolism biosynthetic enzyme [Pycnora praestabilis]|nr:MAG: putative secondary metabolism biosynthetic enzyme [Pycnora praestabilis]